MKGAIPAIHFISLVGLILIGCDSKEIVQSKMYSFEIATWAFFGPSFEAFMYNTDISTFPPDRRGGNLFGENTLYILRHEFAESVRTTDTLTLRLSNAQVDSLYILAYRYVSEFAIDNEVPIGTHLRKTISDGANLRVSLAYDEKLMECSQYRLEGVSHSSEGGPELIEFINRKAPERFRFY